MEKGSGARKTDEISDGGESEEVLLLEARSNVVEKDLELKDQILDKSVFLPKIHRADAPLRDQDSKEGHYKSTVISLGLLGRRSWNSFEDVARALDPFKIDVLIVFLKLIGKGPKDWKEISSEVVDEPMDMKRKYDERFCHAALSSETIQFALALDAIFIVCLLGWRGRIFNIHHECKRLFKYIFASFEANHIRRDAVVDDVFKLENQVPLVLLKNVVSILVQILYEKGPIRDYRTLGGHNGSLRDQCFNAICETSCKLHKQYFPNFRQSDVTLPAVDGHDHLLHYVAEAFSDTATKSQSEAQDDNKSCCCRPSKTRGEEMKRTQPTGSNTEDDSTEKFSLPTATELNKRSVTFQGHRKFSLEFKPGKIAWWTGTLFLPQLPYIQDQTEQIWRNIVAWEQAHWGDPRKRPLTNYVSVMNLLVNDERDVSYLLKGRNPVIQGVGIGGNHEVAALFHSVSKNIVFDEEDQWFSTLKDVKKFYNHSIGKYLGEFVKTYFSRPWLVISVLAATVLLACTVLQTLYTLKAYYEST